MHYRLLCLCWFLLALPAFGENESLSRTLPKALPQDILTRLTPLQNVLDNSKGISNSEDSGVILLKERYVWGDRSGRRFKIHHLVYKALTEQGSKYLEKDNFRYDEQLTKIHLLQARTVLPDGTIKKVADNAAFLQRGRDSGSSQTYHSDRELVIIYPDIKVGSITESIVIYEDVSPRIEGEFMTGFSFHSGWPTERSISTVDLPDDLGKRLRLHHIGAGVPQLKKSSSTKGRTRWVWEQRKVESSDYEPQRAPSFQAGPAVRTSTLPNWDAVARWYQGLLEPRAKLSPELKALAKQWTKSNQTRKHTINALYQRVANDVRYTGLEFGLSGLQPYDCNDVWKNQYGDCKDKSNLLCALLRHCGVTAYLALVETEHRGITHQQLPTYQAFNHAIVAIPPETENGEWLYCDPTIRYGKPGLLSPSSSNRNTLVVQPDRAVWKMTPTSSAGSLTYDFNLKLNTTGQLEGWMTLSAEGYYSISTGESYHGRERDSVLYQLNQLIQPFFAGALVADYVIPSPEDKQFKEPVVVKAYFTCPAIQPDQKGRIHLSFPSSSGLISNYGTNPTRQTDFYQWPDQINVTANIKVPEGYSIQSAPPSFEASTPYFKAEAKWNDLHSSQTCQAIMRLHVLGDFIPATKIAPVQQASRALNAWLEKSALIHHGDVTPALEREDSKAIEMTLMPTGEGQLDLLDRRYPLGGSKEMRESALKKVIQWFPGDANTVFIARSRMAYLNYCHDELQKAEEIYSKLLSRAANGVDIDERLLAKYLYAMVKYELDEKEQAIGILVELASDDRINDYRKGWTHTLLADYLYENKKRMDAAAEHAKLALTIENEHQPRAMQRLFLCYCHQQMSEQAAKLLLDWASTHADQAEDTFKELESKLFELPISPLMKNAHLAIQQSLKTQAKDGVTASNQKDIQAMLETLAGNLRCKMESRESNGEIRKELLALFDQINPNYLKSRQATAIHASASKLEAQLNDLYNEDNDQWLKVAGKYFRSCEPNGQFTHYLWQFLAMVQWKEHQSSVPENCGMYGSLAKLSEKIPHHDDNYWECQFLIASHYESMNQWESAVQIYKKMSNDPQFNSEYGHACWHRMGKAYEGLGMWGESRECHLKFVKERKEFESVCSHICRAGLVSLKSGNRQQAIDDWKLLQDVPRSTWAESENADAIHMAIHMANTPEESFEYWDDMDQWWREVYLEELKRHDLQPESNTVLYSSDQASNVEAAVKLASSNKNWSEMLESIHPVFDVMRFLPCYFEGLYATVYNGANRFSTSDKKRCYRLLAKAAGAINVGKPEVTEIANRVECALLYDVGEHQRAHLKSRLFLKKAAKASPEHLERLTWLYLITSHATGKDLKDSIAKGLKIWNQGPEYMSYHRFALALSNVMTSNRQPKDAIEVLKKASKTKSPDDEFYQQIQKRLQSHSKQSRTADSFQKKVSEWVSKHKPAWYGHLPPYKLDDELKLELEGLLQLGITEKHRLMHIKSLMLAAQSDQIPLAERHQAFIEAVILVSEDAPTWKQHQEIITDALGLDAVPDLVNRNIIWRAFVRASYEGHPSIQSGYREHPAYQLINESTRKAWGRDLVKLCKVRASEAAEEVESLLRKLGRRNIDGNDIIQIEFLFTLLLGWGELEKAQEIYDESEAWEFVGNHNQRQLEIRLKMLRGLKIATPRNEVHQQLVKHFSKALKLKAAEQPKGWQEWITPEKDAGYSTSQRHAIMAQRIIKKQQLDVSDLSIWFLKPGFWAEHDGKVEPERLRVALKTVLDSRLTEKDKSFAIIGLIHYGMTIPQALPVIENELANWVRLNLGKGSNAATACLTLARHAVGHALPKGEPSEDLINLGQDGSTLRKLGRSSYLSLLLRSSDQKKLSVFLDYLPSSALLEDELLFRYYSSLRLLGDDALLKLLDPYIAELIEKQVMDAWRAPEVESFIRTCRFAIEAKHQDLLTEVWMHHVISSLHSEDKPMAKLMLAVVNQQWGEVLDLTESTLKDERNAENQACLHYYRAQALLEQGRLEEAKQSLGKASAINPISSAYSYMATLQCSSLHANTTP